MSGWVRDSITLCNRIRYFVLPKEYDDWLRVIDNPADLECAIRHVLTTARPELAGCTIEAMHFDYDYARWSVLVAHELLPGVAIGSVIPREDLVTDGP